MKKDDLLEIPVVSASSASLRFRLFNCFHRSGAEDVEVNPTETYRSDVAREQQAPCRRRVM